MRGKCGSGAAVDEEESTPAENSNLHHGDTGDATARVPSLPISVDGTGATVAPLTRSLGPAVEGRGGWRDGADSISHAYQNQASLSLMRTEDRADGLRMRTTERETCPDPEVSRNGEN